MTIFADAGYIIARHKQCTILLTQKVDLTRDEVYDKCRNRDQSPFIAYVQKSQGL